MSFNEFYKTFNILPFPNYPLINIFFIILFFSIIFEAKYTENKFFKKILNFGFFIMISIYSLLIWVFMTYYHISLSLYKILFFRFFFHFLAIYSILIVNFVFILKYKNKRQ